MQLDQIDCLRKIGTRLKATHVSDQMGIKANHLLPYFGVTKWDEILPILNEINYHGDLVFESHTNTQNIPDELLINTLKLSVDIGNYLISIINKNKIKDIDNE